MTKKTVKVPAKKAVTKAASAAKAAPTAVKKTAPAAATPATATKPAPSVVEPKKIDMNKQSIKDAIAKGKELLKEGKTKADVAMVIFEALKAEDKDVVIAAFVQGAGLTEKGSVTYWYNCKRKAGKTAVAKT
jgi:transcriptional/translational regulatory protein YebC/TACO1